MGIWGWSSRAASVLAGIGMLVVAGWSPAAGAAPNSVAVLGPGQVVTAAGPAGLTVPADGRVRARQFDAVVIGVGWPADVQVGGHEAVAGSGQRLVVFSVTLTEAVGVGSLFAAGTRASASVEVRTTELSVPMDALDRQLASTLSKTATASGTFSVSVPAHQHHVVLAMTQDGFTQRFDLWTLQRLAPDPAVLYRAQPGSFSVTASSTGTATLPITDPAGHDAPAQVSVRSAVLSAFSPSQNTGPPRATKAYLVVQLAGTTRIDHTIAVGTIPWTFAFTPLPGSRLTFTPTGLSPQSASTTPSPQPAFSSYDDGLFDVTYTFVVPATVTSGTLGVTPGTFTGQLCSYQCGPTTGAITLGAAQLPLTFPSLPAALHAQKRAPWIGAPLPSSEASSAAPVSPGAATVSAPKGTGGFPLWAAVLIPALLALAVYGVTRARRSRTPALVGAPGAPPAVREHSTQPTREPPTRTHPTPSDDAGHPGETPTAMPAPSPTATSEASSPQVAPSIPPEGAERSTEVPELGDEGDVVVRVLGPVVVAGWQAPRERRTVLTSLLCFLAINAERPRRTEELLVTAEGSEKTLRNNLSRLRQSVGTERFPDATVAGGYRVVGVATDWGRFCDLVAEARTAAGDGDAERADGLLAEALRHVRGVPFEGAHPGAFGWALDTGLVHQMTSAIVDAAHRLSEHRLAAGDPVGATVAARLGQRAAPDEFVVWRDLFAVARAQSDPSALARLSAESTGALGAELARALSEGRTPFAA